MDDTTVLASPPTEARYALVVGVNGSPEMISHNPLGHAEEDARKMAEVLQQRCGCELVCEPLIGAQAETGAVRKALQSLVNKRTEQDLLIFYFAGHGSIHQDRTQQRQVYLVTADFDPQAVDEEEACDAVSLGLLREWFYEKTKAGSVLLLLDCCYAGNSGRIAQDLPLDIMFSLFKTYLGGTDIASANHFRITLAATGHDASACQGCPACISMTKCVFAA